MLWRRVVITATGRDHWSAIGIRLLSSQTVLSSAPILQTQRTSRLAPEVLRSQLRTLLQDPAANLERVEQLKGVLYNLRATRDRALTLQTVERFVRPGVADSSVDAAVFTLALQVLQSVGEIDTAVQLYEQLAANNAANVRHVSTLLHALRQTNQAEAFRSPANVIAARVAKGLEIYSASIASVPSANGSVILAVNMLALINSAGKTVVSGRPEWVQRGRDIVSALEARGAGPSLLVTSQLIMLVAKQADHSKGLAEAKAITAQLKDEQGRELALSNSTVLSALLSATLDCGDPRACVELYEESCKGRIPREGEFQLYLRACLQAGEAPRGLLAVLLREDGGATVPNKTTVGLVSALYKLSLDRSKFAPSPDLKALQAKVLAHLVSLVQASCSSPSRLSTAEQVVSLYSVTGPVALHFALSGNIDELLHHFPRHSDLTPPERALLQQQQQQQQQNQQQQNQQQQNQQEALPPAARRTAVSEFWYGLGRELRVAGRWRNLLSLTERVFSLQGDPRRMLLRDQLAVLGHCLYALSAAGRSSEALGLLRSLRVGEIASANQDLCATTLLLRPEGPNDSGGALLPLVLRFLFVEAKCTSPRLLAHAREIAASSSPQLREDIKAIIENKEA